MNQGPKPWTLMPVLKSYFAAAKYKTVARPVFTMVATCIVRLSWVVVERFLGRVSDELSLCKGIMPMN